MLPGPNVSGWTRIAIPPSKPVSEKQQWSVDSANHTLICTGDQGHEWLRYDARQFDNFLYHVEWRFTPVDTPNPQYNSGVFFRNDKDGTIWHQAQTGAGAGGYIFADTLVNGELKRVNLSKDRKGKFEKPAGEWNTTDIRCEGKHCTPDDQRPTQQRRRLRSDARATWGWSPRGILLPSAIFALSRCRNSDACALFRPPSIDTSVDAARKSACATGSRLVNGRLTLIRRRTVDPDVNYLRGGDRLAVFEQKPETHSAPNHTVFQNTFLVHRTLQSRGNRSGQSSG